MIEEFSDGSPLGDGWYEVEVDHYQCHNLPNRYLPARACSLAKQTREAMAVATGDKLIDCDRPLSHPKVFYRLLEENGLADQFPIITLRCFSPGLGAYPCLKGNQNAMREVGLIMAHLFEEFANADDPLQLGVLEALRTGVEMEEIREKHKDEYRLPPVVADQLFDLAVRHVRTQQALKDYDGHRIFKITYNHHLLIHTAHRAKWQNLRMGWCFQGEEQMMKI